MTRREDKTVERFTVTAANGNDYEVVKIQEYLISGGERIPGYRRYELLSGAAVNCVDEDTFELVSLGGVIAKRK